MQAAAVQRPYPARRSPGSESRPASPAPSQMPISEKGPGPGHATGIQPRSSVASSRSAPSTGSRHQTNVAAQVASSTMTLSQIEKSVTHLLVATKQLLEALTQWSRGQATEGQVSDVYVKLGYEFNMACRAFTAINVETADLGNVPEMLRNILEATLSQEASVESLEKYLPGIRDIIINLLHGLKRKQQKLRLRQIKEQKENGGSSMGVVPERAGSTGTIGSVNSGLTSMLDDSIDNGFRPPDTNGRSDSLPAGFSVSSARPMNATRDHSQASLVSEQSSMSSATMQSIPVLPPYVTNDGMAFPPGSSGPSGSISGTSLDRAEFGVDDFPPPPSPPNKSQSALAALQKGGDLERRASRRYSQYQISRHLGGVPNGVPMLAPQSSPASNRGRGESKESMRAVQVREVRRQNRDPSQVRGPRAGGSDSSPVRIPGSVPEADSLSSTAVNDGSTLATPDKTQPGPNTNIRGPPQGTAAISNISDDTPESARMRLLSNQNYGAYSQGSPRPPAAEPKRDGRGVGRQPATVPHASKSQQSQSQSKALTLFLQYKSKVKKLVLPEGYSELSIGRLQLAFIDKFSWNTQNNGVDLPEIYIQDPVSGARYDLDDLSDIKDRTVLVLNVEPLDEVKRHIDDGLSSLTRIVQEVKQDVGEQASALQQVSGRQQEAATEMAKLTAASPILAQTLGSIATSLPATPSTMATRQLSLGNVTELQSLRRDLAVMRQTLTNFQSEMQGSMTTLRNKAAHIKVTAAKAFEPEVSGDSGHTYVSRGRKELNADSDRLVTKVEDLQDLVEDLRKDVVHRGVRPLPRQLETVSRDISLLTKELNGMDDYIRREKPIWTKIWEQELEDVCQGRDELRLMEDLMVDLKDDLEKAISTVGLVEAATKEQMKDVNATGGGGPGASPNLGIGGGTRTLSRGFVTLGNSRDQSAAKEGVLGEVRALQPNHTDRLEAIERAEKLRQRELEDRRGGPLQTELTNFVDEGRLRKSGGVEEVERSRRAKEDRIRREVWDRQNGPPPPSTGPSQTQPRAPNLAGSTDPALQPASSVDKTAKVPSTTPAPVAVNKAAPDSPTMGSKA